MEAVSAVGISEYSYKLLLVNAHKISIRVSNTITGDRYYKFIRDDSDFWMSIKDKFQNNIIIFYKSLEKALLYNAKDFIYTIQYNKMI